MEFLRHAIIWGGIYSAAIFFLNSGLLLFVPIAAADISQFRKNKTRSSFLLLVLR